MSANLTVIDHPVIRHKLSLLRAKSSSNHLFRELVGEITQLMCFEIFRQLPLKQHSVKTPLEDIKTDILDKESLPVLVPIFRAGLGMLDATLKFIPECQVGMLGLYRDEETLKPHKYYDKLPPLNGRDVLILDPMLATGGSLIAAVEVLLESQPKSIQAAVLLAAPEGVAALYKHYPELKIFSAALDRELSPQGFILPGLGDAGDRLFGT